jgi:hypothetical protein
MDCSLSVRTTVPNASDNDSIKANILDLVMLLAMPAGRNFIEPPVSAMPARPS